MAAFEKRRRGRGDKGRGGDDDGGRGGHDRERDHDYRDRRGRGRHRHDDLVVLVRNHEQGNGAPFAPAAASYDPSSAGGTTPLVFDSGAGRLVEPHASLSGTIRNCAGGPPPAGTWLTCEETDRKSTRLNSNHQCASRM